MVCLIERPLKMVKNAFFHLKSSFRSQNIKVFVTTFWSCKKNGLSRTWSYTNSMIRNIRLTSKFMTSQPDLQTIATHILPNISQSKGNQTMKFGRLIFKIIPKMRQRDWFQTSFCFVKKLNMR